MLHEPQRLAPEWGMMEPVTVRCWRAVAKAAAGAARGPRREGSSDLPVGVVQGFRRYRAYARTLRVGVLRVGEAANRPLRVHSPHPVAVEEDSPTLVILSPMLHPGKDGRRLVQSTLWNLLGQVVPVLSAVVAIPVLVRALGTDRFGILTLAWVVIGYFSLFDFGIGRALTKVVAEELNAGRLVTLPKLVRGAFLIMGVLSLCATAVMLACSRILVERVLKIPVALRPETLDAFYVLALCVPVVILSTGLRGVLEAYMRFDLSNAVRVPLGIFTFLGPLLVLPFTTSLVAVIAVLFKLRKTGRRDCSLVAVFTRHAVAPRTGQADVRRPQTSTASRWLDDVVEHHQPADGLDGPFPYRGVPFNE